MKNENTIYVVSTGENHNLPFSVYEKFNGISGDTFMAGFVTEIEAVRFVETFSMKECANLSFKGKLAYSKTMSLYS